MTCRVCEKRTGERRLFVDPHGKERAVSVCEPCFEKAMVELPQFEDRFHALLAAGIPVETANAMMREIVRNGAASA